MGLDCRAGTAAWQQGADCYKLFALLAFPPRAARITPARILDTMTETYDVAVIGGGFAGLMVVAHIARNPVGKTARLYWTDAGGHRLGTAYATGEAVHRLNVRADRMSAWMGGGEDFLRWLNHNYPKRYEGGAYVPRMVYAEYLREIRNDVKGMLGDRLTTERAQALAARWRDGAWHVTMADGQAVAARHIVIATGNPPVADPHWPAGERFIPDFWAWRLAGGRFDNPAAPVVIVGSGLSAVDAVLSLRADGYRGVITAVSPHGRFPTAHAGDVYAYPNAHMMIAAMMNNRTARGYLRIVRAHIRAHNDVQWRAIVNALRERTVMLWQALPLVERARFMRHLFSYWNSHRHRMAPEIAAQLADDSALAVIAGRVQVTEAGDVILRHRGDDKWHALAAGTVINCTGPNYRRMVQDSPLLASLVAHGQLALGPLGLGVALPVAPGLHVIGTALLGERLETTAVPDLRQQAAGIATRIAATL